MQYLLHLNTLDLCNKVDALRPSQYDHPGEPHDRTEQNIYFIDVNCTVSCQIHEYNNKFTNGHNRCIHDLTTKS